MNNYNTRLMIRRDLPEVIHIDNLCNGDSAWTEDQYLSALRVSKCIGQVAELGEAVAGFMVYELQKDYISLLHIAVAPEMQRRGVGTALISKLISSLTSHRRTYIDILVRETALGAQFFLKSLGFKAVKTIRDVYFDTGEDGYFFKYELQRDAVSVLMTDPSLHG